MAAEGSSGGGGSRSMSVVHEGWLQKQGDMLGRFWHPRYFELIEDPPTLQYRRQVTGPVSRAYALDKKIVLTLGIGTTDSGMHTLALIRKGNILVNLADENHDNLLSWKLKLSAVIHGNLNLPSPPPIMMPPSQVQQQVEAPLPPQQQQSPEKFKKPKLMTNLEDKGSLAPVNIASPSNSISKSQNSISAVVAPQLVQQQSSSVVTEAPEGAFMFRQDSGSVSFNNSAAPPSGSISPSKQSWSTRLKRFVSSSTSAGRWLSSYGGSRKDLLKADRAIGNSEEELKGDLAVGDSELILNSPEAVPADDSIGQFHQRACWAQINQSFNHSQYHVDLRRVVQKLIDEPYVTNWRLVRLTNGMRISELQHPSKEHDFRNFKSVTRVHAPAIAVFELIKQNHRQFRSHWDPVVESASIEETLCHSTDLLNLNFHGESGSYHCGNSVKALRHTLSFGNKFLVCELYVDAVVKLSLLRSCVVLWSGFIIDPDDEDADSCIVQQIIEAQELPTLSYDWVSRAAPYVVNLPWTSNVLDLLSRVAGIREMFDQSSRLLLDLQKMSQKAVELEAASGRSERQLSPLRNSVAVGNYLSDVRELSFKELCFLHNIAHPIRLEDVELDDFQDGNEFGMPGFVRAFEGGMLVTDRVQVARQRGYAFWTLCLLS
jgi:hypothetical protein